MTGERGGKLGPVLIGNLAEGLRQGGRAAGAIFRESQRPVV